VCLTKMRIFASKYLDMISDIETTDIKASYTVSRVLWTLLDTVFAGDDEEDALSFFDKELLDDILRFGTIAEVARRKGMNYETLRKKVGQAILRLEKKIKWIDIKEHQIRHDLAKTQTLLEERNQKIKKLILEIIETKANLEMAQSALDNEKNKQTQREDDRQRVLKKMAYIKEDQIRLAKELMNLHVINLNIKEELRKMRNELQKEKNANAKLQEKEAKLKERNKSLENLFKRYKKEGRIVIEGTENQDLL